ncbi:hypothetical protein EL17_05665 [Anditalea andensis]|uniref:Uncharacterized protein n=1 Tax=Anditalea andensis TaxID=1048983 RepID=A0A074KYW6_9BACT|nr:hypothetical protein EL17_05665 [Anditalea andensis]
MGLLLLNKIMVLLLHVTDKKTELYFLSYTLVYLFINFKMNINYIFLYIIFFVPVGFFICINNKNL